MDRYAASAKNRQERERENEIKSIFEHNFLNKHLHSTDIFGNGSRLTFPIGGIQHQTGGGALAPIEVMATGNA